MKRRKFKAQGYDVPDELHSQDMRKAMEKGKPEKEAEVTPKMKRKEARKKARSAKDEA